MLAKPRPRTAPDKPRPLAETGQALAEYSLVLALVAVVAISALLLLGGRTSDTLSAVGGQLQAVPGVEGESTTAPSEYTSKKTCTAAGYTWVAKKKKVPAHCS